MKLQRNQIKEVKRSHPFYALSVSRFNKQYKNVASIDEVYINDEHKVYAATWRDSKNVINFIGGFAPDVFATIKFID